jgi:outer membrane protein assembly factor BamA
MLSRRLQTCKDAKVRKLSGSAILHYFLLFVFVFHAGGISAQSYSVALQSVDTDQPLPAELLKGSGSITSSAEALDFIKSIVPRLQERGYLAASVDSVGIAGSEYRVHVFVGKAYRWARLTFDSIPPEAATFAGLRKEQWAGKALSPRQLANVSEKLLRWSEDNGYPFARAWVDAVSISEDGGISGNFILDKGAFQEIDTVDIHGSVKVSRNFVLNYLDLKQNEAFSEKKLRNISARIRELPFLQEAAPWTFEFKLAENRLNLFLKEKKANQLNAIVGLLPNNAETGRFLLTVDALFAFQNILAQGESISLSYQNLQYKSPRLRVDLVYPYLLNTRFGADVHFDLFKNDTTFRRTSLQAGVRYQLSPTDYLRVYYHNQSNRLITVDTTFVRANKRLPDNIDVSANGAGIEIGLNRTDYRLNPRRGWEARLTSSALVRAVKKSDAITGLSDASGFDYNTLYDTLLKRQYQYFLNGALSYYLPIGRKMVFKSAYQGGWIGGAHLFRNELYQIGGFRLLRGFDEQSIFTNHYHIATLELRLLLDQNSSFYLFSDNGYVESNFNGMVRSDIYNGFGLGTTLETKSGLFTISYALGRNSANSVQFRQSKVHFGYVAYF